MSWYGTKDVHAAARSRSSTVAGCSIRSTQVSSIPAGLGGRWYSGYGDERLVRRLLDELPLATLATHTFPFERAGETFAAA